MELRRGTVSSTRHTLSLSGGGNNSGISTKHHALFSLDDGTTVVFNSGAPAIIRDGDQVVVAGKQKGRLIKADAYWNKTAHVSGNAGQWSSLLLGSFVSLLGMIAFIIGLFQPGFLVTSPLNFGDMLIAIGIGLFFSSMGFYHLYRWLRIRAAVRLLNQ
jgi:hypothetical protein